MHSPQRRHYPRANGRAHLRRDEHAQSLPAWLDRYNLPVLDDLACVRKDQAETGVLFELITARYEKRSPMNRLQNSEGFGAAQDRLSQR